MTVWRGKLSSRVTVTVAVVLQETKKVELHSEAKAVDRMKQAIIERFGKRISADVTEKYDL